MLLPSPRPDPASQLLEAIRRRDPAATALLTRRWAHRRGVSSLEDFCFNSVIPQQGLDGGDWLQKQLEGGNPAPSAMAPCSPVAPPALVVPEAPAEPVMLDAPAALEAPFLPSPLNCSAEDPDPAEVSEISALPRLALLGAIPASTLPAPAPSTLADLRSWLSGAPQHSRAG